MTTCRLCGKETDAPCGPIRGQVCPSCWLAVGDDMLCEWAPDLETALGVIESQKAYDTLTEMDILFMLPDSAIADHDFRERLAEARDEA